MPSKDRKEKVKKGGALCPIAEPLAGKRLTKKILKLVNKGSKRNATKRGVKEVVKSIKKTNELKGSSSSSSMMCILAGDISPIDVITHIPILCEDTSLDYAFVPSKEMLGTACRTKRPTSCVLLTLDQSHDDRFRSKFSQVADDIKQLQSRPIY